MDRHQTHLSYRLVRAELALLALAVAAVPLLAMLVQPMLAWLLREVFSLPETAALTAWCLGALPIYLVSIPIATCIARTLPTRRPCPESLPPFRWIQLFCLTAVLSQLTAWLVDLLSWLLPFLPEQLLSGAVEEMAQASPLWMTLLFSVVLAPLFEEFFYRKVLLDRLAPYGTVFAMLVGGVLFGLVHGNLSQLLPASVVGILLSYVYLRTGRLWATVLLHAGTNLLSGVLPVEIAKATAAADALEGWLTLLYWALHAIALCIALFSVRWWIATRRLLPAQGWMEGREWRRAILCNPGLWVLAGVIILLFLL